MKIRTIAAAALLAACLTSCGEADDAPLDDSAAVEEIDTSEDDTAIEEPESELGKGDAVPETTERLRSVGITDDLVQQLAAVGQVNNYGLSIEKPMTEFEKQGLAIGQMMNCQDVNAGDRTYEELMQEDMSTGATWKQVSEMYGFLEESFCPHVRPEPAQ
ncbi:hypothetical protein KZO11_38295 [Streptomyces anulatus]|uniref:hypothetical protein n=1 Tax=Streptomyces anulatus TaxID=1892 RepID=UPI001C5F6AC7|nr:hypothetical protein [Streptomyces anulatus]QYA98991.1 hypothetical protein KZO11_38295 [Streptomyces anulatus]